MENKSIPHICGSCAYLITEEGEPYYCAIKDLYTFRKPDDKACWEFTLPKEMTMETTDYVSYPIALALKKAGFDWKCDHCYAKTSDSEHEFIGMTTSRDYNKPRNGEPPFLSPICSAPTLWQAQKWLRKQCGIHIDVCIYSDYSTDADGEVCDKWDFWGFDLYVVVGGKKLTDDDGEYDSYEQALSTGIEAVLELIEKKGE